MTEHHVRLKRRDNEQKIWICDSCHRVIHGMYPGTQLARRRDLWTIDGLKADPLIAKAVAWVAKQQPGKLLRMRERR